MCVTTIIHNVKTFLLPFINLPDFPFHTFILSYIKYKTQKQYKIQKYKVLFSEILILLK